MGFLHQRGGKANLQGGTKSVQDGGSTTIARRKRAFQVFPVTWESDRESKRQISDLQYPKIRRYEAVDGLSFIAQINDFGTRELIGRQKDRILPDCFLQKKMA